MSFITVVWPTGKPVPLKANKTLHESVVVYNILLLSQRPEPTMSSGKTLTLHDLKSIMVLAVFEILLH